MTPAARAGAAAVAVVRETRVSVYEEAPSFRLAPRALAAAVICIALLAAFSFDLERRARGPLDADGTARGERAGGGSGGAAPMDEDAQYTANVDTSMATAGTARRRLTGNLFSRRPPPPPPPPPSPPPFFCPSALASLIPASDRDTVRPAHAPLSKRGSVSLPDTRATLGIIFRSSWCVELELINACVNPNTIKSGDLTAWSSTDCSRLHATRCVELHAVP